VRRAVTSGFNLVMPADPEAPLAEYAERVSVLTAFAHEHGVAVEAEVGELPSGVTDHLQAGGSLTDPDVAAEFAAATGVDLLAVSVGNVHIKLDGSQKLDLRRLEQVRDRVPVPLVLHGGTGIAADSLREAIALGVAKVNYGTYLKQAYLAAVRTALGRECPHPHRLLGMGGTEDILVAGRMAVRDAVLERIGVLGCCGRADR
jgi:fructose/tagatose bisphosphate aldolase